MSFCPIETDFLPTNLLFHDEPETPCVYRDSWKSTRQSQKPHVLLKNAPQC